MYQKINLISKNMIKVSKQNPAKKGDNEKNQLILKK